MRNLQCLGDNDFAAYIDTSLSEEEIRHVDSHLDACASCREQASFLAVAAAAEKAESVDRAQEASDTGTSIGRYLILKSLGSGSMGLVVEAYDPSLDRHVAIKLLRPDLRDHLGEEGKQRLRREAQVMAQLSDPNVVSVHDVGSEGDRLFIAMERIEGESFTDWLASETRSWRDILRMCCQAGDGLAAAHSRGIVHRDFKPDNVLIRAGGDSGNRAVVTDFGLAGSSPPVMRDEYTSATASASAVSITQTGVLVGTPAYMAPELFSGESASAASDQFSFCVTTFHALYGERPFAGATIAELADSVRNNRVAQAKVSTRKPKGLRKALERGLHANPSERFTSMPELLAALRRTAAPRRLWLAVAVTSIFIAAIAATFAYSASRSTTSVCEAEAGMWLNTLGEARRERLRQRFVDHGVPDTFRVFDEQMARFGTQWQSQHQSACQATRIDGTQSDSLLDLRMQCLNNQLGQVEALLGVAEVAAHSILLEAGNAAARLPSPVECADLDRLQEVFAMPRRAAEVARIKALQKRYSHARALFDLGNYKEALGEAQALREGFSEILYPPLLARAHLLVAEVQLNADPGAASEAAKLAALQAAIARDDYLIAESLLIRATVLGYHLGKPEQASEMLWHVEAAITRAGDRAPQRASLARLRATLLRQEGKLAPALADFEKSLEEMRSDGLTESIVFAETQRSICGLRLELGALADAEAPCQEAVDLLAKLLGAEHPLVANAKVTLGITRSELGDPERAGVLFREALTVMEAAMGNEHPTLSPILGNLGNLLHQRGDFAGAIAYHERALATANAGLNAGDQIAPLSNLSYVYYSLGDAKQAVHYAKEAVATSGRTLGDKGPSQLYALLNLAGSLVLADELIEASLRLQEGREIAIASLGQDHPLAGDFAGLEGDILLARGKARQALPLHEQARQSYLAAYGEKYPELIQPVMALAEDYLALGQYKECALWADDALARLTTYGPHPRSAILRFTAAQCHATDAPDLAHQLADLALHEAEAGLASQPASAHLSGLPARIRAWKSETH